MEDKDFVSVMAVNHAAGWLDDLAIPRPAQLLRPATTLWMVSQLCNVIENALDEC